MNVQVYEARAEIQELIVQNNFRRQPYAGKWQTVITFMKDGKVIGTEMKCHECERDAKVYLALVGFDD